MGVKYQQNMCIDCNGHWNSYSLHEMPTKHQVTLRKQNAHETPSYSAERNAHETPSYRKNEIIASFLLWKEHVLPNWV